MSERAFKNVIRATARAVAKPAAEFLAELDAFIDAHDPYRVNQVIAAIGDGSASIV